ncbi:hypothetical protein [Pseudoalteromonas sp. ESRF-bin5]|uniref:hypothetical protein n=1 Tax=Pseudoalteromonas sp. ESRF-bin5 TaxID=2014532 RepID=UPI00257CF329|nr:hypothetical protein [Pseudoalteromonas sp. ESRF-bin5]
MTYKNRDASIRSESMNKWIGRIEDETELDSIGDTPTARMEDLIEKIKCAMGQDVDSESSENKAVDDSINTLIAEAFEQGVKRGFNRSLDRFMSGAIKTKKVPHEDKWSLHSASKQYQIKTDLPTVCDGSQSVTVKIKLSECGFE